MIRTFEFSDTDGAGASWESGTTQWLSVCSYVGEFDTTLRANKFYVHTIAQKCMAAK